MADGEFTKWQRWDNCPAFSERSFIETLDGGQTFRWNQKDDYYEGRWSRYLYRLRFHDETLTYSTPVLQNNQALNALEAYFACETRFSELADQLPWRTDPVLKTAIEAFPGLRILRQPFAETLFCFLCSSTKQIPQIKAICETVARTLGQSSPDGSYALPTWSALAEAGEAPLRAAKLGYRARYIAQCAKKIAGCPEWLNHVERLPTSEAREQLISLPGVGRKIADCTLLFGAGRLDAFPIDTWVEKILVRAYRLDGWSSDQLQQFAHLHFGPNAGLAHQYLFAAARAGLIPA